MAEIVAYFLQKYILLLTKTNVSAFFFYSQAESFFK